LRKTVLHGRIASAANISAGAYSAAPISSNIHQARQALRAANAYIAATVQTAKHNKLAVVTRLARDIGNAQVRKAVLPQATQ